MTVHLGYKFKVAIYVLNHNYGHFLRDAIESVLSQYREDYQIILIDDGSSDCSRDILSSYELDSRIDKIIFQDRIGLTRSNNIALSLCEAEYIMRLDADDILNSGAISIMSAHLDANPDCGLVFPNYNVVDADGDIIYSVNRHDFNSERVDLYDLPAHGACTLFRASLLHAIGGYDEGFSRQDGYDIWLSLLGSINYCSLPLKLFKYRKHGASLTDRSEELLKVRHEIFKKHYRKCRANKKVIIFIPIRGPSIDSSDLSMNSLLDKRLVEWTICAALNAAFDKKIVIVTSDKEVDAFVREKYRGQVEVFLRERALAKPSAPLALSIKSYFDLSSVGCDYFLILDYHYPFRTADSISSAVFAATIHSADGGVSIIRDEDIFFQHDGAGLKLIRSDGIERYERNNLFRHAGGITLVTHQNFLRTQDFFAGRLTHIEVNKFESFRVGSEYDLGVADYMACSAFPEA